jgi:hypothetical protein
MSEEQVVEQVAVEAQVPKAAASLSDGLKKLVLAVVANHKGAPGAALEIAADIQEAVKDLGPALASAGMLSGEVAADPIGVAEAFAVAGFELAKGLKKA